MLDISVELTEASLLNLQVILTDFFNTLDKTNHPIINYTTDKFDTLLIHSPLVLKVKRLGERFPL